MKLELAILLRRIKEKIGTVALILIYIVIIGVIIYIVKYHTSLVKVLVVKRGEINETLFLLRRTASSRLLLVLLVDW